MNLPTLIRTLRWMTLDTLRQAIASKLFWVMLFVTAVGTILCLSVRVHGGPKPLGNPWEVASVMPKDEAERIGREKVEEDGVRILDGRMSVLFGAFEVPIPRGKDDFVRQIHVWLGSLVADTVGILFALIWTAGFLPTFLEPQSASVMLAKPLSRWSILLGKYLGVVFFVGLNATIFVASTWTALGVKTNCWDATYWLAVPLLLCNFAVFYAVSTFLAVCTRSTVAAAFGTLIFWAICWVMNFAHHRTIMSGVEGMTPVSKFLLEAGYWFLPKPFDMGNLFFDAMRADVFAIRPQEIQVLMEKGQHRPELAAGANAAFAVGTLAFAAYEFESLDY